MMNPSPTNPTASPNPESASESPETASPDTASYQPPTVRRIGTLPASTGMPVSAFQLGDEPTR